MSQENPDVRLLARSFYTPEAAQTAQTAPTAIAVGAPQLHRNTPQLHRNTPQYTAMSPVYNRIVAGVPPHAPHCRRCATACTAFAATQPR